MNGIIIFFFSTKIFDCWRLVRIMIDNIYINLMIFFTRRFLLILHLLLKRYVMRKESNLWSNQRHQKHQILHWLVWQNMHGLGKKLLLLNKSYLAFWMYAPGEPCLKIFHCFYWFPLLQIILITFVVRRGS